LNNFWHKYYLGIRQSKGGLFSHLIWTVFLHYLAKQTNTIITHIFNF